MTEKSTAGRPFLHLVVFSVVIPLLLIILLYEANVDGPIDLFHEGEALAPASETLRGKLPFRDVYLQHGWGVNLIKPRVAFSLFGVSVAANRKLEYGGVSGYLIPLAWIAAYFLLYSLFARKLWVIPTLGLLAFADVLINDRHMFPFLSLALLLPAAGGSRVASFLAGAFAVLGIVYSLDTGLYAVAIGIAFIFLASVCDARMLPRSVLKPVLLYSIGLAAAALPFVAYLSWKGILDSFLLNSYFQIKYQAETWGMTMPVLKSLLGPFDTVTERNRTIYLAVKWYYPIFVYACISLLLVPRLVLRRLEGRDRPLLMITLMGIIFFRSAIGRADEGHLMYAIAPFWVLNICFLDRVLTRVHDPSEEDTAGKPSWLDRFDRICFHYGSMIPVVLGLVLYFWATCRVGGIVSRKAGLREWRRDELLNYVVLDLPRSGEVKVPPNQAEEILQTVAAIHAHSGPDEPIFDFSSQGAYYFLADRTNSTPYCQAAYAVPDDMQQQAIGELEQNPPALVLERERGDKHGTNARQQRIGEWIQERYIEKYHIDSNWILLPKPLMMNPL